MNSGNATYINEAVNKVVDQILNPFNCSYGSFQLIEGKCFEKISNFKPLNGFNTRAQQYVGNYISSRRDHTSWYKLKGLLQPFYKISLKDEKYLEVSDAASLLLFEVSPGLFRAGKVVGNDVYLVAPFDIKYGFKSENQTKYFFINQDSFEVFYSSLNFSLCLWGFFVFFLVSIFIGIIHAISAFIEIFLIYKSRRKKQQDISFHDMLGSPLIDIREKEVFSRDDELLEEINRFNQTGPVRRPAKYSMLGVTIFSILNVLFALVMIITCILNAAAISGMNSNLNSQFQENLSVYLNIPVATTVLDVIMLICLIIMIVHRIYLCCKHWYAKKWIFSGSLFVLW